MIRNKTFQSLRGRSIDVGVPSASYPLASKNPKDTIKMGIVMLLILIVFIIILLVKLVHIYVMRDRHNAIDSKLFSAKYGNWVIVTGASRGIGYEFCKQLAQLHMNVILTDILPQVELKAKELAREFNIECIAVVSDFNNPNFLEDFRDAVADKQISLLILNHLSVEGTQFREFLQITNYESMSRMIDINIKAVLNLVSFIGNKMATQKRGGIILISSGTTFA